MPNPLQFRQLMPPAPLTERPTGLLDLLGLKNGGQYPQHLGSDFLLPTVDLLHWYAQYQRETRAPADVTYTNLGTAFNIDTVPNGEVWLLWQVSLRSTASVAATVTGLAHEVWTAEASGFVENLLQATTTTTGGATSRVSCSQSWMPPWVLLPGTAIWVGPTVLTGSGFPVISPRLRVTRCIV